MTHGYASASLIASRRAVDSHLYAAPVLRPLAATSDDEQSLHVERAPDIEIPRAVFDRSSILDVP
jgi:hypothetical protein